MGTCGSCGGGRATVTKFKVTDKAGNVIGEYPTRVEAERKRLENPGANITPVAGAAVNTTPGPATNSQAKPQ